MSFKFQADLFEMDSVEYPGWHEHSSSNERRGAVVVDGTAIDIPTWRVAMKVAGKISEHVLAAAIDRPEEEPGFDTLVNLPPGGICFEGGADIGPGGGSGGAIAQPCKWWQYFGCFFYGQNYAERLATELCESAATMQQTVGQLFDPNYRCGNVSTTVTSVGFCKWEGTCTFECE